MAMSELLAALANTDVRCSRAGLSLTVADHAYTDKIGLVHDGTERDTERIAELTTLVDGSGSLSVDVTGAVVRNEANMELRK